MANTPLNSAHGRQYPLFAEVTITAANMNESGVAVTAIKLPYGAQVIGGAVIVDQAFDPTTATADVGDAGVANRYLNDVNLKAVGRTPLTLTGNVGDGSDIVITPTFSGAVTAGKLRVQAMYVIGGRAHEVQPS